ncbi:RICIN domain-containing protein [Paractinoplanes durhamensis]|uniref:RICIN domain-containing protein n=1 Tax=Paractinoplanes durhamensis TaxID=113563 RepID=UPI00363F4EBE
MRKLIVLVLLAAAALIGLPGTASAAPATGVAYQLKVTKSGMCIDVPSASTANSALLQQWGCTDGAKWQQFTLTASGSNYQLVNVNSGKCIDVPNFATTSGTQLQQYTCVSSQTNQQWQLVASGTGTYQIINVNSGLCISDAGASTSSGAAIIQETCTANTNKQWAFAAIGGRTWSNTADGFAAGTTGVRVARRSPSRHMPTF